MSNIIKNEENIFMKKVFAILFCICIIFCGCSQSDNISNEKSDYQSVNTEEIEIVDSSNEEDIPSDLNEAYKLLDGSLSDEDIAYIRDCTDEDLAMMHFGLGLWIRNNWIYQSNNKIVKEFAKRGINHPDDISGLIIKGYRLHLNELPCEIDEIIK